MGSQSPLGLRFPFPTEAPSDRACQSGSVEQFPRRPPLQEGPRALGINRSGPRGPPTTVSWRESLSSLYSENLGPLLEVKPTTAMDLPGVVPKGALPISHACLRCVQQLLSSLPVLLPSAGSSRICSRERGRSVSSCSCLLLRVSFTP